MIKTVTGKLLASVAGVEYLDQTFPGVGSFKGRVAMDIRVERGTLSIGKRVRLTGPHLDEVVEVVGIEMHPNLEDPSLVRILCSKPSLIVLPTGRVTGWNIVE